MRWLILLILLVSPAIADPYSAEIQQWQEQRQARLRQSDGWLSLAGLYWLRPGENRFGSSTDCDLTFPKGPDQLGSLLWVDPMVFMTSSTDIEVNGQRVLRHALRVDEPEGQTVFRHGSLSWYLIRRDGRLGVRLKDRESPVLKDFRGLQYYPVNPNWRLRARFEPFETPRQVRGPSVIAGLEEVDQSPGELVFEREGKSWRLLALSSDPRQGFSLLFADRSNGHGSYPGGRFLSLEAPDENGQVWLDFNKAYSPPCLFTPYATCPQPLPQNRLDLNIEAGEKADH